MAIVTKTLSQVTPTGNAAVDLQNVADANLSNAQQILSTMGDFSYDINGNLLYKGKPYSLLSRLDEASQQQAIDLANQTDVRSDGGVAYASFGIAEQEALSRLTDELLDKATQFELDQALNTSTDELTELAGGLDLSILEVQEVTWWSKLIDQYFPWFSALNASLREIRSIRNRLGKVKMNFKEDDAKVLTDLGIYGKMGDQYEANINAFLVSAAASEIILDREEDEYDRLATEAEETNSPQTKVKLSRQRTVRAVVINQTFNLLEFAINADLKIEAIENSKLTATLTHQSVIKAIYHCIDELKNSLAMIINAYRIAKINNRAMQVEEMAEEALQKSVETGRVTVAILKAMSNEQKNAIGKFLAASDTLATIIVDANDVLSNMKGNLGELMKAGEKITHDLNAAHIKAAKKKIAAK